MSGRPLRKPTPEATGFPLRLRKARLNSNLAQAEVAKKVGVTEVHYGRYERGKAEPTADVIRRIAEVLNTSCDYLLLGQESQVATARFQDPHFLRTFQDAEQLPSEDKAVLLQLLEAFIFKRRVESMTRNAS